MVNFAPPTTRFETVTLIASRLVIPLIFIASLFPYISLWTCTDACTVSPYHFIIPTAYLIISIITVVKERYVLMSTFLSMSVLLFGILVWLYTR